MTITKIGHACLVIEEQGATILFDPGNVTTTQQDLTDLNAIIITHSHADHLDPETLPKVVDNNPGVRIIANSATGQELDKLSLTWDQLEDGQQTEIKGITIEAEGSEHHFIHSDIPAAANTGYLIAGRFFHPGDAYHIPSKKVEILAAPFAAPWGTIGQSIDYVKAVKPKQCFPIHDGMLKIYGPFHYWPQQLLPKHGIEFIPLEPEQSINA